MSKITAAYQQFSHRVQQQPGTRSTDAAQKNSSVESKQSSETPAARLNKQQQTQLRQLRESGTLDNLQAILSEDESSLLSKLFPEERSSYDAGARVNSNRQHIKGGLLDTKL